MKDLARTLCLLWLIPPFPSLIAAQPCCVLRGCIQAQGFSPKKERCPRIQGTALCDFPLERFPPVYCGREPLKRSTCTRLLTWGAVTGLSRSVKKIFGVQPQSTPSLSGS